METRNYKNDLQINSGDLQSEWIEQPSRYMYYAEAYADAVLEKDKAKNNLDIMYARLEMKLRSGEWEKHFEKYPSEGVVNSYVIQREEYQKCLEKYHKACHDVNLMQSAKTAFDHRRKALENLVTMMVTGFHSEPKVSKLVTRRKHLGLRPGTKTKKD